MRRIVIKNLGIYWWKTSFETWNFHIDIGKYDTGNSIYFHFFNNFRFLEWCIWKHKWSKHKPVITEFIIGKEKGRITELVLHSYNHHYKHIYG